MDSNSLVEEAMAQLVPCPNCSRHVRQTESACPFCETTLSLGHIPAHPLPRTRLGRAATFAFGATLVAGATALVGCGGDSEEGKKGGGGSGGSAGSSAGQSVGGSAQPVYGAPAAGTGNDSGGTQGSGGTVNDGGGAQALYGAVPVAGSENTGGTGGGVPLYGAAPAD